METSEYMEDEILEATTEMYTYYLENIHDIPPSLIEELIETTYHDEDLDDLSQLLVSTFIEATGFKGTTHLRKVLQETVVAPALAKKEIQKEVIRFTGEFMNKNSKSLTTSGPVHSWVFGESDVAFFYNLFGIDSDKISTDTRDMLVMAFDHPDSFKTISNAPHKILFTSMIIESLQKEYGDMLECLEYLMGFCEYPMLYNKYWKMKVKEETMDYTIENLTNKFKIKKMNTIQELLKYDMHVSIKAEKDRLLKGEDEAYVDFINKVRVTLNSTLKNISIQYYKNHENNASLHVQSTTADDGSTMEMDGQVANVNKIVDNTYNSFLTSTINKKLIGIVCELSEADADIMSNFISMIMSEKTDHLLTFINNVVTSYFVKHKGDTMISGKEFISFGAILYRSMGTSKDKMLIELKGIVDHWMHDVIKIETHYKRVATIIGYRRAIFNYLILLINYYN